MNSVYDVPVAGHIPYTLDLRSAHRPSANWAYGTMRITHVTISSFLALMQPQLLQNPPVKKGML